MKWLEPWWPTDIYSAEFHEAFHRQLEREVPPGHVLHGVAVQLIARGAGDDALFQLLDGSGRVAEVHLTWAKNRERLPWPVTAVYASLEEWAKKVMVPPQRDMSEDIAIRRSARLILLDPEGRLMLFRYDNGHAAPFWATAGGELQSGEDYRQAVARELQEETGFTASIGPLLRERDDIFAVADQPPAHWFEQYYLVQCESAEPPDPAGWTDEERVTIRNWHWWSLEEMRAAPPDTFRPDWLPELLQELVEGGFHA